MLDVYSWAQRFSPHAYPWLVYGKGPTFSLRSQFNCDAFQTIALNHTIEQVRASIFHAVDIDVVDDCQQAIRDNAEWVLMPWHPHRHCRASGVTLKDFMETLPVLQEFEERERLLYYDFFSGKSDIGLPKIKAAFSASAIVQLLGGVGVRKIRTLGIDGGQTYSNQFDYLKGRTLLANGHSSFDSQFPEIHKAVETMNIDYKPMAEPIRIFVGTDDTQMLGFQVLEHSIRQHTDWPVEVFPMRNMPLPEPRHAVNKPGTGFSFNRFLIPKLAGYSGRAIYMDADMLVFDDISKLWNIPMNGRAVLCSNQKEYPRGWATGDHCPLHPSRHWKPGRQLSVMVLDCDQLDWDVEKLIKGLDDQKYTYKELMADMCVVDPDLIGEDIPNSWNCLEWYEEGVSQNVHFTVVPTQPWKNDDNELTALWESAFEAAVRDNAVDADLAEWSVRKGYVKPSLLEKLRAVEAESPQQKADQSSDGSDAVPAHQEASQLRRMLWDVMIREYEQRSELKYVKSSVSFHVEDTLIRRPAMFGIRALKAVGRRTKRLISR